MSRTLFIVGLVCIADLLYGQSAINFKAGINLSNARSEYEQYDGEASHHKNEVNGYAGVSMDIKISPVFYFVPELAYIGMGYKNPDEAPIGWQYTRFYYITLPLSFRYQANDRFSMTMGGYLSYMTGGETYPIVGLASIRPVKESFREFDAGLQVGSECIVFKQWGMGGRYFYGLYDIDRNKDFDLNGNPTAHDGYKMFNRGLQIYAFYRLALNKKSKN